LRRAALDRYALYELCVTSPLPLARFLHAAHGRSPHLLGEDFSGSGPLSRAWASLGPRFHSVAVDQDAEPLARLRGCERVSTEHRDVLRSRSRVDILACTNFPIGYWHTRESLLRYLRHARSRLNSQGMLVCDLYGGSNALSPGSYTRSLRGPHGERIEYTWEQRSADPLSHRVRNAIHFRVREKGESRTLRDAFEYDWRLWSIPELSDAIRDAGFRGIDVYHTLGDAIEVSNRSSAGKLKPRAMSENDELPDPWVVYVVARR
jgi:hypothetical protein